MSARFGRPDEGCGVVFVMVGVVEDGCDQRFDATKDSPPQTIFGQITEEALRQVQPRAAGRREVTYESGDDGRAGAGPGDVFEWRGYPRSYGSACLR